MEISKLKEGMSFKNYKELCSFLKMDVKSGTSKKAQIKELERHCEFYKVGHSFSVKQIYNKVLQKIDNRGAEGFYKELLPLLITDHLLSNRNNVHYITRNAMLKNVQMINQNYAYGSKNVKKLAQYTQIDEQTVYDFFNTSNSNFKKTIERALDKLMEDRILFYQTAIMMVMEVGSKSELIEASESQLENIMVAERKAMHTLDIAEIKQVRGNPVKWDQFTKLTVEYFNEEFEEYGVKLDYYYSAYKIIVNNQYLEEDHNNMLLKVLNMVERVEVKNQLNETVCERLLINAKKRRESTNKISYQKAQQARSSFSYISDSEKLIELLVDNKNTTDLKKATRKI